MSKSIISISVDTNLIELLRLQQDLNISELINSYLKVYLLNKVEKSTDIVEEIKIKEQELEALKHKHILNTTAEQKNKDLEIKEQNINKWFNFIVEEMIIKQKRANWFNFLNGYQNILKDKTGLVFSTMELEDRIKKLLIEKGHKDLI